MWNETKQQQLNQLQKLKDEGNLSDEERNLLEALYSELEQEEWQKLNPSLENLRSEQIELQKNLNHTKTQNAILSAFAMRQEDLLKKAKSHLISLRLEQETLRNERARMLEELAA